MKGWLLWGSFCASGLESSSGDGTIVTDQRVPPVSLCGPRNDARSATRPAQAQCSYRIPKDRSRETGRSCAGGA